MNFTLKSHSGFLYYHVISSIMVDESCSQMGLPVKLFLTVAKKLI